MQNKSSKCHHFTMRNLKPGLGLKFDFRSSQKVKLTWQNYIPAVKGQCKKVMYPIQCMLPTLYHKMKYVF